MVRVIQVQGGCAERLVSQEQMDEPAEHHRTIYFHLFAVLHEMLFFLSIAFENVIFIIGHSKTLLYIKIRSVITENYGSSGPPVFTGSLLYEN